MTKRKVIGLLLVLTVLCTMFSAQLTVNASAPTGWRNLTDIVLYSGGDYVDGWAGSEEGVLETEYNNLPVDTEVTYENLPSLRLNVQSAPTSWWEADIALRGWNNCDISQYVPNGCLEFNIKGAAGGEQFFIGLRDNVPELRDDVSLDCVQAVEDYCTISTEWNHVKIPLKDIVDVSTGFDPSNVLKLVMYYSNYEAFKVWLNDIKITSPDKEKGFPAIKVNQVGYLADADKVALVSGFEDELSLKDGDIFELRNSADNTVKYRSTVSLVKDFDAIDSGERIFKADFSKITDSGEYYIYINGLENSPKFKIGNDVYKNILTDASRYFYYQRAGLELDSPYCTDFPREDITPEDAEAKFASIQSLERDLTKGWYDAGDTGKYVNSGATAVSDLFWAYEMFPGQFTDKQFNIPESGNGIADILDEAKWELEWMLKMQDEISGGFYSYVQTDEYDLDGDGDTTERIIQDTSDSEYDVKSTDDTACAAAVLAHASIIYKDIAPDFAKTCLFAAKDAWNFLDNNPQDILSPFGPYSVENDYADRLWAAAALFRATGESKYDEYFLSNYSAFSDNFSATDGYAHFIGMNWLPAFFNYLKALNYSSTVKSWFETQFTKWSATILERYKNNPWKNSILEGNYFWGINATVLNTPMDVYIGSKLLNTNDSSVSKIALDSLNWILGTNPLCKSFVTGYGDRAVNNIYSYIYSFDGKQGVPKGVMPGGPDMEDETGISRFAAKSYNDNSCDSTTNDNGITLNSSLVFMCALANISTAASSEKISISGYVKPDFSSNNKSINAGFKVSVTGTNFSAVTDSLGFFKIEGLPRIWGYYNLEISKEGYLTRKIDDILGSKNANVGTSDLPVDIWGGNIALTGTPDTAINMSDIMSVATCFNTSSGNSKYNALCDLDKNGAVNMTDIMIAAKHFNTTTSSYPKFTVS